jgi:hypothetical protein
MGTGPGPRKPHLPAYPTRVEVRGRDRTDDNLMGQLSFTEYLHVLLTGREPSQEQRLFPGELPTANHRP